MTKPVYIFCFQAYNDIDHMTPVIDRLRRDHSDIDVVGVIFAPHSRFKNDFRIRHLESIGVPISHVIDHIGGGTRPVWLSHLFYLQARASSDLTPRILRVALRLLGRPMSKKRDARMAAFDAREFIGSVANGRPVRAVCYDHTAAHPAYNDISKLGRVDGFFTAALPHAVDNWDNELLTVDDIDPFPNQLHSVYQADAVLVPDNRNLEQILARREVVEGQGVVLGSPRFCDEWVSKIRTLAPSYDLPKVTPGTLKVTLMMCRAHLNIFEDEVMRMIELISRILGVELIVKLHTRNHLLGKKLPDNVHLAGNDVPSHDLIDWADLTLFSATSVILDNLKLDKPVLFLRRTVANKLIFERYIQSWNVDCRDELRDIITGLRDGLIERTYTVQERDAVLSALVEPKGRDVLALYVDYIVTAAEAVRARVELKGTGK